MHVALASGAYFYRLQAPTKSGQAGECVETKRLVLRNTAKVVMKETVLKVSEEMRIRNATKEL